MSCRKTVCAECATRWEGINYCVTCLQARRAGVRTRGSVLHVATWAVAVAVLGLLAIGLWPWAVSLWAAWLA
jgi:hypothetical protein